MSDRVKKYEAPECKVYDWAEPRYATIYDEDGNSSEEQEHLYAKIMFLGTFDHIENYVLVDAPKKEA